MTEKPVGPYTVRIRAYRLSPYVDVDDVIDIATWLHKRPTGAYRRLATIINNVRSEAKAEHAKIPKDRAGEYFILDANRKRYTLLQFKEAFGTSTPNKGTFPMSMSKPKPDSFIGFAPLAHAELVSPTLNLNGSSARVLIEDYTRVIAAIDKAVKAVYDTNPHGRDYQTLPTGTYAHTTARYQHIQRVYMLERVRAEFEAMALNVSDQQDKRKT